jgi:undecaprenyl-phosphate galactose phosphotransferase/putative colanic acid biosynthesis UDP-glucose lipid carrier transferase
MGLIVRLIEALAIVAASILGQVIYQSFWLGQAGAIDVATGVGLIAALIYVFLARYAGLYRLQAFLDPWRHFGKIISVWFFGLLALTAMLFLLKIGSELSRGSLLAFSSLGLPLLLGARLAAAGIIRSLIARGAIAGRLAVVIGEPIELGGLSAANLLVHFGSKEVGRIIIDSSETDADLSDAHTTKLDEAIVLARQRRAEEFVIALGWNQSRLLAQVNEALRNSPLPVRLLPDRTVRSVLGRRSASAVGPMLSVELQRAPMTLGERAVKRLVDLALATIALLTLSPLLVIAALAIKLDSKGPVIFRQRRGGFDAYQFVIYKFRTMRVLEDSEKITQARREDPRVTRIGQLLRRASIDELPQLFNVLKGDMSLVGPRPHALAHDNQYQSLVENYCFRHHVKPGITGWAQVNGLRGETGRLEQMQRRVEFDLWYINNWSLILDIRILLRTARVVLKPDGY